MRIPGVTYKLLAFLMLLSFVRYSSAQDIKKPLIISVDVDSDNHSINIQWEASATPDIDEYEIYSLKNPTSGNVTTRELLATVSGCSLQYTLPMTDKFPQIYTVVAVKDGKFSLIGGDYHIPMKLELAYDSCAASIDLNWSKYVGWKNNFSGYKIYEIDGEGNRTQLQILDSTSLVYTRRNVQENKQYKFLIEAFSNDGRKSKSNMLKYFTYMPPPPSFVNLNHVTVQDEQSVEISFSTELNGEIDDYMISRARAADGAFIPWKTIYDVLDQTIVEYDYFPTQAENFYYRVDALNGCGYPVSSSNIGTSILLSGQTNESDINLQWNTYESFGTGTDSYDIYRMNMYNEFELISNLPAGSMNFSEPISNISAGMMNGQLHYYVEAHEAGENPLGIRGFSKSNVASVNIETHIFLPNAFTPNGDGQNDVFIPIYDFFPEEFKMFIYDRAGKMIFYSSDPATGWDGTIGTGGNANAGVYVYHVEYLSFNGRRQVRTGNLSLIYP